MALGTIADHLSPQAGLVEGREQSSQEEDLWGAAAGTPHPHPHTPLPQPGEFAHLCVGHKAFT